MLEAINIAMENFIFTILISKVIDCNSKIKLMRIKIRRALTAVECWKSSGEKYLSKSQILSHFTIYLFAQKS